MNEPMSPRRTRIIEAATAVFLRYGFAKTTMVDIAEATGLTRPTLYLEFPDKESVFHAVVNHMVAAKLTEIRAGLGRRKTLEAKLRFACDAWGSEGFDMVRANPDAADMFELGFTSVCQGYEGFGTLLEEILREPAARRGSDRSAHELARMMVYAIKGFKDIAKDGADMRRLVATQVAVVAAALSLDQSANTVSKGSKRSAMQAP
jgi:AcrR family transcriptional regulator